jgi:hypothetical protein
VRGFSDPPKSVSELVVPSTLSSRPFLDFFLIFGNFLLFFLLCLLFWNYFAFLEFLVNFGFL